MAVTGPKGYTSFLGRGWSFPPEFSRDSAGVVMVADELDILQSLRVLLATAAGERLLHPTYGCNLNRMVFEPLSTRMRTQVAGFIEQAILMHEPRIKVDSVSITPNARGEGWLDITVDYTVRATNSRYNLVYPFYLTEQEQVRS